MNNSQTIRADVAIVGAGPAGIAAATVAAESGKSVVLLDDNPRPGGQIWRGGAAAAKGSAALWLARLARTSVHLIGDACVFNADGMTLFAEVRGNAVRVAAQKIILATGSRERFLPFPGWTLPNVMGAGAFQALMKTGLPVSGKRVVIAGTGPLLLAVASYAVERGANVVAIAEQTSWLRFLGFGISTSLVPGKAREAIRLLWQLRHIPQYKSCWPVAACGRNTLESVRLSHGGTSANVPCDYLACGYHLVPCVELAQLLGCRILDGFVATNDLQQSSMPNVYCAGEPTGIGGVELSLLEGEIAGHSAADQFAAAKDLFRRRSLARRNVRAIARAFALREELKSIWQDETILCRCEDVSFGKVRTMDSWRAAKLHTRCGMGPCQGRICGGATEFLFGWNVGLPRPPLFPVSCSSLRQTLTESDLSNSQGVSQ